MSPAEPAETDAVRSNGADAAAERSGEDRRQDSTSHDQTNPGRIFQAFEEVRRHAERIGEVRPTGQHESWVGLSQEQMFEKMVQFITDRQKQLQEWSSHGDKGKPDSNDYMFCECERGDKCIFDSGGLLWDIMTLARESGRKEDDEWQEPLQLASDSGGKFNCLNMNKLVDEAVGRCVADYSYEFPRSALHLLRSQKSKNGVMENIFSVSLALSEGGSDRPEPFLATNTILRSLDGSRCPNAHLRVLDLDMICCSRQDVRQPNGFFIPPEYEGWPCVRYGHFIKCHSPLREGESPDFRNKTGPLWEEAIAGFSYIREMAEVMRFGENRPEREENAPPPEPRSHELSAETAQFCGLFGPAIGDGESRAVAHWRRERDWIPTSSGSGPATWERTPAPMVHRPPNDDHCAPDNSVRARS
jgi:hypothetical protein